MSGIQEAKEIMHKLHDGVEYGGGLVMSEQVQGTVDKIRTIYKGPHKAVAVMAAYLHKAMEAKRINPELLVNGQSPYKYEDIQEIFGTKTAMIVNELASEPSDKKIDPRFNRSELEVAVGQWRARNPEFLDDDLTNKEFEWMALADWAKGLSTEAQIILLAEKLQNFEVSRDKPNMKKPLEWHKEYYETRMIMCDSIREVSPQLYHQCVLTKNEGMAQLQARQAELDKEIKNRLAQNG